MSNDIIKKQNWQMTPTSLDEAIKFSELIAKSDLVPKDYKDKPANVLIAMQMGAEVGLSPMQAIQSIAIINGRPSVWGDAMLALCQVHPDFEWIKEYFNENNEAVCIVKRKGYPEHAQVFGIKDMVQAGYDKKPGPWQTSRLRMMQLRPRSFALRNTFADALKGLSSAEEAMDIIEVVTPTATTETKSKTQLLKDKLTSDTIAVAPVVTDTSNVVADTAKHIIETNNQPSEALTSLPDEPKVIEGEIIDDTKEHEKAKRGRPSKSVVETIKEELNGTDVTDRKINHGEWNAIIELCTAKKVNARSLLDEISVQNPKDLSLSQYKTMKSKLEAM